MLVATRDHAVDTGGAYIVDVRDVDSVSRLLEIARSGRRVYIMLFSERCYRNAECYDVDYIMRSDSPGYGLILDYDPGAKPGHISGYRVRGCALWHDYDLPYMLIAEHRPDVVIVSDVPRDSYLADATTNLADELGIEVRFVKEYIPGDIMAVFREGRASDVADYLRRAVERLREHAAER